MGGAAELKRVWGHGGEVLRGKRDVWCGGDDGDDGHDGDDHVKDDAGDGDGDDASADDNYNDDDGDNGGDDAENDDDDGDDKGLALQPHCVTTMLENR